jgi:lysophospholipase L1-like esterase
MPIFPFKGSSAAGGSLLFVRDHSSGPHSADSYDANAKSLISSSSYGFGGGWANIDTSKSEGHFITPGKFDGAAQSGHTPIGYLVPHAIQVVTDSPCLTILQTGDSINSGVSSSDGLLSPGLVASRLIRQDTGINSFLINEALSGDISENFFERGMSVVNTKPTVALVQCYSRNDQNKFGDTYQTCLATYQRAIVFCSRCVDAGVLPILETAFPFAGDMGMSLPQGRRQEVTRNRETINTMVRDSGFPHVDYDFVLGHGKIHDSALSNDGIHPNDAGIGVMGRAAASVITDALGICHGSDEIGSTR